MELYYQFLFVINFILLYEDIGHSCLVCNKLLFFIAAGLSAVLLEKTVIPNYTNPANIVPYSQKVTKISHLLVHVSQRSSLWVVRWFTVNYWDLSRLGLPMLSRICIHSYRMLVDHSDSLSAFLLKF